MTVEADDTSSGVFPDDLNAVYPENTDAKKEGARQIRLIKRILKNTLPNVTEAITATAARLNRMATAYLHLSGTQAETGSVPLRLSVTDAGSDGICSIQFNTAGLTNKNIYLRQKTDGTAQFTLEGRLYAQVPVESTSDWSTCGILAYGPGTTDLALVSSTYGNGSRLVFDGTGLAARDLTDTAPHRFAAGQLTAHHTVAGYLWNYAGITCYAPGGQYPSLGLGGSVYGGSLRLNQANGQFEILDGSGNGFLSLFAAGIRLPSYGGAASGTIELYNVHGRSSYEFSSCDGSWHYHHIHVGGAYQFLFRHDGGLWAGAFHATSDRREKDNIETLESPLAKALALDPVTFNFVGQAERKVGLIAQDVADYLPEAVGEYPKGEDTRLSLDYNAVATLAIGAIKELTARLEAAEARIAQLEGGQ